MVMTPGYQFSETIEGREYRVVYTQHFVARYAIDEPGRPAVRSHIKEETIAAKAREALPFLDEIAAGDPDAEGVIKVLSLRLNMVFALREHARGFTVSLVTMMRAPKYRRSSPQDYEIELNPIRIRFSRDISPLLRDMVVTELAVAYPDLEEGIPHHLRGETVEYWVECAAGVCYADAAGWLRDMYEVYIA